MNTIDVIKKIAEFNPGIIAFKIVKYDSQKDLAKEFASIWTLEDDCAYRKALSFRDEFGLPFWNALMVSIINSESVPANCLEGASLHHHVHEWGWVKTNQLDEVVSLGYTEERLAFNSKASMRGGQEGHIPMLDFHVPASEGNLMLVKKVCSLLSYPGYILNSGKSFHFIGKNIIPQKDLIAFLGKALLFTPIVDEIWIAHQLQDGACSLRFTVKHGVVPTVVAQIK